MGHFKWQITIKSTGREYIYIKPGKSHFNKRTAYQSSQIILEAFERVGLTHEYIKLTLPRYPDVKGLAAEVSWTINGEEFSYRCNSQKRYLDNLGVIANVIEMDTYAIRTGLKSFAQVMAQYKIGYDPNGIKIRTAREIVGVDAGNKDFDYITYKWKQKAKELHPDVEGSTQKMQELNGAYEELKKELGVNGTDSQKQDQH